jgi:hypothetical protein
VTKTVRIHEIGNGIVSIVCIVLSAIDENVRIHGIGIVSIVCIVLSAIDENVRIHGIGIESIVCIVFHHLPCPFRSWLPTSFGDSAATRPCKKTAEISPSSGQLEHVAEGIGENDISCHTGHTEMSSFSPSLSSRLEHVYLDILSHQMLCHSIHTGSLSSQDGQCSVHMLNYTLL